MRMTIPDYEWRCQSCQAVNAAGAEHCRMCGCSACFTMAQLRARKPAAPVQEQRIWKAIVLFSAGAGTLVVYTAGPSWMSEWFTPQLIFAGCAVACLAAIVGVAFLLKCVKGLFGRHRQDDGVTE